MEHTRVGPDERNLTAAYRRGRSRRIAAMTFVSAALVGLTSCASAAKHESSTATTARCAEVASGGCSSGDFADQTREQWKRENERRDEQERRDEFLHRQNALH